MSSRHPGLPISMWCIWNRELVQVPTLNETVLEEIEKVRKAHMLAARLDPEGFAEKANRRNNAETGNHAFKAILGDQIYSKSAQAQRCEILCMCIAYNLTRLTLLEVKRGIEIDFQGGADLLAKTPWVSLAELHAKHRGRAAPRPEWTAEGQAPQS
ncbi:MAG: hypothetical protein ACREDF_04575 [Thermoplasmata archaeon]